MKRYIAVALALISLLIFYLAYEARPPPATGKFLQTGPEPTARPARSSDAPTWPDGRIAIPDIADHVADPTPAPAAARIDILSPADGATLGRRVAVRVALEGMRLAPAGTDDSRAAHHHLLIDTDLPVDMKAPIRQDRRHIDFSSGESEADIELSPGRHTLQILLGDGNHAPHNPPVLSKPITITVRDSE